MLLSMIDYSKQEEKFERLNNIVLSFGAKEIEKTIKYAKFILEDYTVTVCFLPKKVSTVFFEHEDKTKNHYFVDYSQDRTLHHIALKEYITKHFQHLDK